MRIAFFDCVGGASGDMLLGALLDAGATESHLREIITGLHLEGCSFIVNQVMSGALSAKQVTILTPQEETERHATELMDIIDRSDLPKSIKERSTAIIRRLAGVEAQIHNASIETVHLHEISGYDTLIDIAGVLNALDELKIEKVYVSSLPLARGLIQSMHGLLPLPAPATLALLGDVPVHYVKNLEAELVTPTGAALLTSLADGFEEFPPMQLKKIGVGAGHRRLPFPNVIRVWIGETRTNQTESISEMLTILETNIDDLNPQVYEHVTNQLFAAGALDVSLTSIQMKKNRPGELMTILCHPQDTDQLQAILFSENITLGVRRQMCERISLPRKLETVTTPYGDITVKVASWGEATRVMPEYEECRSAAENHHVPLLQVMAAAKQAYRTMSGRKGRVINAPL